jgi:hypothetical protein
MAPTRSWPHGPQRRLPRVVAPFESVAATSYTARLAHANHIGASTLRRHVAETANAWPRPDWLAIVSGQPAPVICARLRGFAGDAATIAHHLRRPLRRLCMASPRCAVQDARINVWILQRLAVSTPNCSVVRPSQFM